MKATPRMQHGSFGIPPALQEARKKMEEKKELEAPVAPKMEDMFDTTPAEAKQEDQEPSDTSYEEHDKNELAFNQNTSPEEMLKRIGVELTEKDFHDFVFKGYVEKEITVIPEGKYFKKPLIASFRLLTAKEYDLADEILSEELQKLNVTREGYEPRKNMIVLAFSVTKIGGKNLTNPVLTKDKKFDSKATAVERRKVLQELNGLVVSRMMTVYSVFSSALSLILNDPKAEYLKK